MDAPVLLLLVLLPNCLPVRFPSSPFLSCFSWFLGRLYFSSGIGNVFQSVIPFSPLWPVYPASMSCCTSPGSLSGCTSPQDLVMDAPFLLLLLSSCPSSLLPEVARVHTPQLVLDFLQTVSRS